jgi:hypothetical protein
MPQPDFLIIGGMKCGSSSLHYYLSLHPEISMTKDKDLHFFSNPKIYQKGLGFYQKYLDENNLIKGESTVSYSMLHRFPETVNNILETLGNEIKLIYLVRDPIERIISHYIHNLSAGRERSNLNDFVSELTPESSYVQTSHYNKQISGFLKHFDKNNILILSSENLRDDRKQTLKRVFEFLGVDSHFYDSRFDHLRHRSKEKLIYNQFGDWVGKTRFIWRYKNKIPFTGKRIKQESLSKKNINKLQEIVRDDIQQFKLLTGNDFNEWKTFNKQL